MAALFDWKFCLLSSDKTFYDN